VERFRISLTLRAYVIDIIVVPEPALSRSYQNNQCNSHNLCNYQQLSLQPCQEKREGSISLHFLYRCETLVELACVSYCPVVFPIVSVVIVAVVSSPCCYCPVVISVPPPPPPPASAAVGANRLDISCRCSGASIIPLIGVGPK
jgi:hypothetical protein